MHGMWARSGWGTASSTCSPRQGLKLPTGSFPELGFWFLVLAAITLAGAIAALFESLGLVGVLAPLTTASALAAIHYLTGSSGWETAAGWVLLASSWVAFYVALRDDARARGGEVILPLGKPMMAANKPGARVTHPIEWPLGEPGVRQGQKPPELVELRSDGRRSAERRPRRAYPPPPVDGT